MSLSSKTRDDYVFRGAEPFRVLMNQRSTGLLLIQPCSVAENTPASAFWIDYYGYPATPPPPPFTATPFGASSEELTEFARSQL